MAELKDPKIELVRAYKLVGLQAIWDVLTPGYEASKKQLLAPKHTMDDCLMDNYHRGQLAAYENVFSKLEVLLNDNR